MRFITIFTVLVILFFTRINAQVITLTSPTVTANWQQGTFKEITWAASNVPFVDVMISLNGGATFSLVQASVPSSNAMVLYTPSGVDGTQAIFKVKSSTNPGVVSNQSAVITFSTESSSSSIDPISLAPTYCTGKTFTVSYYALGAFQPGNTFMLVSSSINGDFNNAIQLGKVTTTVSSGVITCKFPDDYIPHPTNNVVMLVSDMPAGQSNQVIATVTNFSAAITSPSNTVYSQTSVTQNFTCAGNLAGVTSYTWSFGDGYFANTQSTAHAYSNYGNYSVSLRMTNANGCAQMIKKPYLINIDPLFGSAATIPASPVFDANDVTFLNQDTAVAVGKNGMTWRSIDGAKTWSVIPTFTGTKSNNSVIMKNKYICIAGDTGTVTFSNDRGASWSTALAAEPLINYQDVSFADTTFGVAVGQSGDAVVYHWLGSISGWEHIPTFLTQDLHAIAAYKTSNDVFTDGEAIAVGDQGVISKYSFSAWNNISGPTSINLKGIYLFPNNLDVIVCGDNGLIMRSPDFGVTWNVIQNGTPETLHDVRPGVVPNQIIVVGDNGVIYESLDNGFSFTRYTSGFPNARLRGVSSKSPKGAFAGSGGTLRLFSTDSVKLLPITVTGLCPGDPLKVKFNLMGTAFTPTFTANLVLSDNTGDFLNSTILNSKVNPYNLDSIIAFLPDNIIASSSYKIRIELSGNNSLYSAPSIENIIINSSPNASTLTISGMEILATPQASCTYQWYYNNAIMPGQTSATVTTIGNGSYKIIVTNLPGCTKADSIMVLNTELSENYISGKVMLYPNPSSKLINVKLANTGKHYFLMYNAFGQTIFNKELVSANETIDIEHLKPGLYFVYIRDEQSNVVNNLKFIRE